MVYCQLKGYGKAGCYKLVGCNQSYHIESEVHNFPIMLEIQYQYELYGFDCSPKIAVMPCKHSATPSLSNILFGIFPLT